MSIPQFTKAQISSFMKLMQKCTSLSDVFIRLEPHDRSTLFACTDLDIAMAHRYGHKYIKDPKSFGSDTVKAVSPPQSPGEGSEPEDETSIDISTGQLYRVLVLTHLGVDYLVHVPLPTLMSGARTCECYIQPSPSIGVPPAGTLNLTTPDKGEGRIGNRIGNAGKWSEINWTTIPQDAQDLDRVVKIYESYADGSKDKLAKVKKWSSFTASHLGKYEMKMGYDAITSDSTQRQTAFEEGYTKLFS